MSGVVWAAPYTPPTPPARVNPFPGMGFTWTGADGSVWDLKSHKSGVFLTPDVSGLHLPPFEDYTQTFAGLDGQDYDSGVAGPRTVDWNVHLWSDTSSVEWLERERAFWASFRPRGSYGVWTVQDPNGKIRSLRLRLTSDGGFAHAFDPAAKGWHTYQVSLVADDPWWYGESLSKSWAASVPKMFFGGDAAGSDMRFPPLHISQANSFGSATFTNPGDEPTWAKWTLTGPIAGATITVDGGSLGVPAVAAGHTLVINTDPSDPTAFDGSTDKSGLIDPWDPRPFPPGRNVPVSLDIDFGEGASVMVEAPVKYWRAFA